MFKKYLLIFAITLTAGATSTIAQTLPTSLQQCIDSGICTTPVPIGSPITPFFDHYRYFDSDQNSNMELLRYSIGNDAGFTRTTETGLTEYSYFGSAWLSVRSQYSIADGARHEMTLFLEQVSPRPHEFRENEDILLTMSNDALLAGTGTFFSSLDDAFPMETDLESDGPIFCLAEGCYVGAELNLLNVNYLLSGNMAFALVSPGAQSLEGQLLYEESRGFPGFQTDPTGEFDEISSFRVGAVPEPGSGWLLLVGMLAGVRRERKSVGRC